MMDLTSAQIGGFVGTWMWPFMRISALLMASPIFGTRMLPVRIRVITAVALSVIIVPLLPPAPSVDPLSLQGVLISMHQVLIGLVMGFTIQMVFSALVMAGEQMAMSMGLGFASMVDPANGVNVPVISQFFSIIATLLFLALGGHLLLIQVLVESFEVLPVSDTGLERQDYQTLVLWGAEMFIAALHIALPIVAMLLVVYVALGVMTRAAPQLNIFSVGFPLTLLVGFIVMMLSISTFANQFSSFLADGFALSRLLIGR